MNYRDKKLTESVHALRRKVRSALDNCEPGSNRLALEIAKEKIEEVWETVKPMKGDAPEYGKQYALTGKSGDRCISNGNTWAESEVQPLHLRKTVIITAKRHEES